MVDETLDFHVKAPGRDGTQKRQELVNTRPVDLRPCLGHWRARANEVKLFQDKKEQAWVHYRRMPNVKRKKKDDFEKDFEHKAVYNGKIDEKSMQE